MDTLKLLEHYSWPGNVRELVNIIERGVVLCKGKELTPADLPDHLTNFTTVSDSGQKLPWPKNIWMGVTVGKDGKIPGRIYFSLN
jgi:DNA-binding NtrC family response regulator